MIAFFRNCLRFKILFLILMVLTIILDYFFVIRSFYPTYESKTVIFVGQNPNSNENLDTYEILQSVQIGEKLVFDVPEIIYGTKVLNSINDDLREKELSQYRYTPEDIKKMVKTEIVKNSRVVDISVRAKSPEEAQFIASAIATTTDTVVREIMQKDYIHVIKDADYPKTSTGMKKITLWILGVFGGMAMGFLAVLILTIVENFMDEDFEEEWY